jgi:hypothetical protein
VCHIFPRAGLDSDPPIYTSHIAGMTGVNHHAQLLTEMESH